MPQPATLEISTVHRCSIGCSYCPQSVLTRAYETEPNPVRVMSLDTFDTCIGKLPSGAWVDFSGFCEPFLNPHCTQMILHASHKDHPIRVFTTMTGLKVEDIDTIGHIDFLRIHLHLPDRDGIMKTTVDENYCRVFEALLSRWPKGTVTAVCYGTLHPSLTGIVQPHHLNVKIKPLNASALGTRANNVKKSKHVQLEVLPVKKGRISCLPIYHKNNGADGRFNHNVLLPNGDVVLCCSDYGLKHKLGNLLTDDYRQLFESPQYKKIMRGLTDETIDILCRTCEHAVIIDGTARFEQARANTNSRPSPYK